MPDMISPRIVGNAIVCSLVVMLSMSLFAEYTIEYMAEYGTSPQPRSVIIIVFKLSEIKMSDRKEHLP